MYSYCKLLQLMLGGILDQSNAQGHRKQACMVTVAQAFQWLASEHPCIEGFRRLMGQFSAVFFFFWRAYKRLEVPVGSSTRYRLFRSMSSQISAEECGRTKWTSLKKSTCRTTVVFPVSLKPLPTKLISIS